MLKCYNQQVYIYIYIYIYVCVCVCVCLIWNILIIQRWEIASLWFPVVLIEVLQKETEIERHRERPGVCKLYIYFKFFLSHTSTFLSSIFHHLWITWCSFFLIKFIKPPIIRCDRFFSTTHALATVPPLCGDPSNYCGESSPLNFEYLVRKFFFKVTWP